MITVKYVKVIFASNFTRNIDWIYQLISMSLVGNYLACSYIIRFNAIYLYGHWIIHFQFMKENDRVFS